MMDSINSRYPDDEVPPGGTPLDQLASRLLDDGAVEEGLEACSIEERQRLVDLQWLNAMLEQSHKKQPIDSTKAAIRSVLTRIRAESTVPAAATEVPESNTSEVVLALNRDDLVRDEAVQMRGISTGQERRFIPRQQRGWRSSLAIIGTLAVVLILWWPWKRQSADAMFERAMAAAAIDSYDRVYHVKITRRDDAIAQRQAQLTVRGGKKFVFEQTGPLGGKLVIGGNGHEFWLVPQFGPVTVGDTDDVLPEWTQKSGADMPFLQITTALKRMREQYVLTHQPAEELTGHVGVFNHLVARRRFRSWGRFGFAPSQIDLWTDDRSGVVHRLIIQWPADAKSLVPERIEFDLTDQVAAGEDVYDYAHYASEGQIEHLRSSK